jgi:hypothetical protein
MNESQFKVGETYDIQKMLDEIAKLQQELDKQKLATKCQQSAAKGWQAKAIAQSAKIKQLQAELNETKLEMVRQQQVLLQMNENQSIDLEKLQTELDKWKLQCEQYNAEAVSDQAELAELKKQEQINIQQRQSIISKDAEIARLEKCIEKYRKNLRIC